MTRLQDQPLYQVIQADPAGFIAASKRLQTQITVLSMCALATSLPLFVLAWLRVFGGYRSNGWVMASLLVVAAPSWIGASRGLRAMFVLGDPLPRSRFDAVRSFVLHTVLILAVLWGFVAVALDEQDGQVTLYFAIVGTTFLLALVYDNEAARFMRMSHRVLRAVAESMLAEDSTAGHDGDSTT